MKQPNKQAPIALITGAARRIGAAIARYLHQHGFRVVVHYHQSQKEARALVCELNAIKVDSAQALTADLTHYHAAHDLIQQTIDWGGRLNVLVNNASIFKRTQATKDLEESWEQLFLVNVKAPFILSHTAYPHLAAQSGVIINITDTHAQKPLKHYAVYCQTKAALEMQTKALAREFAPEVRVNAVAPGAIIWPEGSNALSESLQHNIIEQTPLKRHGDPLFIAQAVLAMATNPFITGETLQVDGGRQLI